MSPSAAESMLACSSYDLACSNSEANGEPPAEVCPGISYTPREMLQDIQPHGAGDQKSFCLPHLCIPTSPEAAAMAGLVVHSSGAKRTRRRAHLRVKVLMPRRLGLHSAQEVRVCMLRRQGKPLVVALRHVARRHSSFRMTERVMRALYTCPALSHIAHTILPQ
jgi:hypothetical protein